MKQAEKTVTASRAARNKSTPVHGIGVAPHELERRERLNAQFFALKCAADEAREFLRSQTPAGQRTDLQGHWRAIAADIKTHIAVATVPGLRRLVDQMQACLACMVFAISDEELYKIRDLFERAADAVKDEIRERESSPAKRTITQAMRKRNAENGRGRCLVKDPNDRKLIRDEIKRRRALQLQHGKRNDLALRKAIATDVREHRAAFGSDGARVKLSKAWPVQWGTMRSIENSNE